MIPEQTIYKATIRTRFHQLRTYYIVGDTRLVRGSYLEGVVPKIIEDLIYTLTHGSGAFNENFYLESWEAVGPVTELMDSTQTQKGQDD